MRCLRSKGAASSPTKRHDCRSRSATFPPVAVASISISTTAEPTRGAIGRRVTDAISSGRTPPRGRSTGHRPQTVARQQLSRGAQRIARPGIRQRAIPIDSCPACRESHRSCAHRCARSRRDCPPSAPAFGDPSAWHP